MPKLSALFWAFCCVLWEGCTPTHASEQAPVAAAPEEVQPDPYLAFPRYGLVTGTQLMVRRDPDPNGLVLGWLRHGEIVRLKADATRTPTCNSGFYPIYPRGFVCAGEGVSVSSTAPEIAEEERAEANRSTALPYRYYFVKDPKVAELHQVPSRDQQRAVRDYVAFWTALEADDNPLNLKRFLEGKLTKQPAKPAVVRRFLDRGFFVATTGVSVRSQRRFVHTVRGSYVKEQELEPRTGSSFQGVELKGDLSLPLAWMVRSGVPQAARERDDGTVRLVDVEGAAPLERQTRLGSYKGPRRIGDQLLHELADGSLLKDWYVAVAQKLARPKEVGPDEVWVHVDTGEQTLVMYRGDTPFYATLVSSGQGEHATPPGSFRIQRKYISDTMSDIGAEAPDSRYSIDDVPWTQYFDGARALHGAFWHSQFGIARSHGCVNLAPADARYVFEHTEPQLPAGWHGISTQKTGVAASLVVVTE